MTITCTGAGWKLLHDLGGLQSLAELAVLLTPVRSLLRAAAEDLQPHHLPRQLRQQLALLNHFSFKSFPRFSLLERKI